MMRECFGPTSAAFKSSSFPQLTCLQTWGTPYSIIERRKFAESSQTSCLKQDNERIAGNIRRALSQINAFDQKEKVLHAFHDNDIPMSTADGTTYFANIYTHCLDVSGYNKNSQFKVIILTNFGTDNLLNDIIVSSSNASAFHSLFTKDGIAESYRINYKNRRELSLK